MVVSAPHVPALSVAPRPCEVANARTVVSFPSIAVAGPSGNSHAVSLTRHLRRSNCEEWRIRTSFFSTFINNGKGAKLLKEELLQAIDPLDRGAEASPEDQERVDEIAKRLEAVNPTKLPLKSDLLNGKWELLYTTSKSILKTEWPKFLRSRVNFQAINTDTLRAQNMESWPFFNQVTADLKPMNSRRVAVKFDVFKILSLIPIKAPGRARGELEITYLDNELRVSRGDKGNLFILKMIDPSYRVPLSSNTK